MRCAVSIIIAWPDAEERAKRLKKRCDISSITITMFIVANIANAQLIWMDYWLSFYVRRN